MKNPEWIVLHPNYAGAIAGYLDKNLNIVYPSLTEKQEGNHLQDGIVELLAKAFEGKIVGKPNKKTMSIKCVPFSCYKEVIFSGGEKRKWITAKLPDVTTLGELLGLGKPKWRDPDYQGKIADLFAGYLTVEAVADQLGVNKSTLARWNKKLGQRWYS